MTAARFIALADAAIADACGARQAAIVCGGTGLYVRALLLGLFEGPPASPELRAELPKLGARRAARASSTRVDPATAAKIDRNDAKRMIRALEVWRLTGEPMSAHQARHDHQHAAARATRRGWSASPPSARRCTRAIDARVDADARRRARGARSPRCASAGTAPPLRSPAGDRLRRAPRRRRRRARPGRARSS